MENFADHDRDLTATILPGQREFHRRLRKLWTQGLNSGKQSAFLPAVPAYETLQKDGAELDVLESDGFRIVVNRSGAELISLARKDELGNWRGFLYRDNLVAPPASGWANHATVMGYFLHRLWKEQSIYRDKVIKGGNHGFLRHFAFAAPSVEGAKLTYKVAADQVPAEAYPLKVACELSYSLSSEGLRVEFLFTNQEPELDAHVSFGLHPGFAVSSTKDCRVLLPQGTYVRYMAPGNFLNGKVEEIPFCGGDMPFDRDKLEASYILGLEGIDRPVITLEDDGLGHRVGLDFSEVPFLTLWSEMNTLLCIEPCWGLPDSNPPVPFEQKLGIQVIPPGGTLRRGFGILPEFLS